MKRGLLFILCTACVLMLAPNAFAKGPKIKEWSKMEKDDKGEMKRVWYMTIDGIMVHETDPNIVPPPPVVTPAPAGEPIPAPSDAIVLFDGTDLSKWTSTKEGEPTKWILVDGAMSPTKDSGYIRTKDEFGSCQLHVEFATPSHVEGDGQGRGNSGVFLHGPLRGAGPRFVQQHDLLRRPVRRALRPQTPTRQRLPQTGRMADLRHRLPPPDLQRRRRSRRWRRSPSTITACLCRTTSELTGGTGWRGGHSISNYVPHGDKGPLQLQDHGNPVLFRNIWIRELND